MPIAKSIAVYLFSTIFVLAVISAINAYTLSDVFEEENLKNFIKIELIPDIIDKQCSDLCGESLDCISLCKQETLNQTDQIVDNKIKQIYNIKLSGLNQTNIKLPDITVEEAVYFFGWTLFPSLIISFVTAFLLILVAENPIKKFGSNLISISIPCFIIAIVLPKMLLDYLPLPKEPVVQKILDYIFTAFSRQLIFGIIFLVVGISLLIINYFIQRKGKNILKTK